MPAPPGQGALPDASQFIRREFPNRYSTAPVAWRWLVLQGVSWCCLMEGVVSRLAMYEPAGIKIAGEAKPVVMPGRPAV